MPSIDLSSDSSSFFVSFSAFFLSISPYIYAAVIAWFFKVISALSTLNVCGWVLNIPSLKNSPIASNLPLSEKISNIHVALPGISSVTLEPDRIIAIFIGFGIFSDGLFAIMPSSPSYFLSKSTIALFRFFRLEKLLSNASLSRKFEYPLLVAMDIPLLPKGEGYSAFFRERYTESLLDLHSIKNPDGDAKDLFLKFASFGIMRETSPLLMLSRYSTVFFPLSQKAIAPGN